MPALFESGMFVREPAWHGEGRVVDEFPKDFAEARKLADLEWEWESRPVFAAGLGDDGEVAYSEIENFHRIVRNDTEETLSVMRGSYHLITIAEMGEIYEALLQQTNIRHDTLVSLDGGKMVAGVAFIDEPVTITSASGREDVSATYPYLGLVNRVDGTMSCKAVQTDVRIVCANTASYAELKGGQTGLLFSFSHTAHWKDRLDQARETVMGARVEHERYVKLAGELLGRSITSKHVSMFLSEFIPEPPAGLISDRVAKNIEEARGAVRGILASETTAGVSDTAFGLVQAAIEYLDHVRWSQSWETKTRRSLLRPEPLKARALEIAQRVTAGV